MYQANFQRDAFASNLIQNMFIKICQVKPNVGYFTGRRKICFLLLRGTKVAKKFFHSKTFNILFCWSRYIFQNYKENPFSPSRGKNSQVNEPQCYVICVLPMAFIPWIVQFHAVFLFLVGKIRCFLTSRHVAHMFTIMQCGFKTNRESWKSFTIW